MLFPLNKNKKQNKTNKTATEVQTNWKAIEAMSASVSSENAHEIKGKSPAYGPGKYPICINGHENDNGCDTLSPINKSGERFALNWHFHVTNGR